MLTFKMGGDHMNKPITLEQMAQRDLERALQHAKIWDDIFSKLFDPKPGPVVKAPPRISIHVMGGREIAHNIYCADGVNARNQWGWIVDHVKEHFGCDADDVECIECPEGDMIAVCGKICAYVEIE
jgi:hypothetical protein